MNYFRKAPKYRYSILGFNKSLTQNTSPEPLAVVVEGGGKAFIIGRDPVALEGVSEVGRSVLNQLPSLLERQIRELREVTNGESGLGLIERLAEANRWNLAFTPPQEAIDKLPLIELSYALFARHVLGQELAFSADEHASVAHSRRDPMFTVAGAGMAGV
jgi:hypothetical protein